MAILENEFQRIEFDDPTGQLLSLVCKTTGRDFITRDYRTSSTPFAVWYDPIFEYHLPHHESWGEVLPPYPGESHRGVFGRVQNEVFSTSPVAFSVEDGVLRADYTDTLSGLTAHISVALDGVKSRWSMTLENASERDIDLIPAFPHISWLPLPKGSKMLAMNQAGYIADAFSFRGGAYGNCFHSSAQLGCFFDGDDCLGFYIEDPEFRPKDICYKNGYISVRYFPDRTVPAHSSVTLPEAVFMLYSGSWKDVPKAYGDWFRQAVGTDPVPDFVTDMGGYIGFWAENRGRALPEDSAPDGKLTDFTCIPELLQISQGDAVEISFFCRHSVFGDETPENTIYHPYQRRHTDGTAGMRADLGGTAAFREGVRKAHQEGKKVLLYIEGLIVPEGSLLFKEHPEAADWLVENIGGDNYGPYSDQHWLHMCPGSRGWQENLADSVSKLILDTDVDGFRIDSLGGYHWECHNKKHGHKNIHDYNSWVRELSDVVTAKVRSVKPELLISTEEPIDYFHRHFNHALHQITRPEMLPGALLGTAPLRVAFPDYKIYYWGGIVGMSMSLLADAAGVSFGSRDGRLSACWKNAFGLISDLYNRGDTSLPDFELGEAGVFCRHLRLDGSDLFIGLRPDLSASSGTLLSPSLSEEVYTLSLPCGYDPKYLRICDIEKGVLTEPEHTFGNGNAVFTTSSNWFFVIASPEAPSTLPILPVMPERVGRGEEVSLGFSAPGCAGRRVSAAIDGGDTVCEGFADAAMRFVVPSGVRPGFHSLVLKGDGLLAGRRIFEVV